MSLDRRRPVEDILRRAARRGRVGRYRRGCARYGPRLGRLIFRDPVIDELTRRLLAQLVQRDGLPGRGPQLGSVMSGRFFFSSSTNSSTVRFFVIAAFPDKHTGFAG